MANVPYDPTPDVAPRGDAPLPFQRSTAGDAIARGINKLADGAVKAGAYYDQTVTDDAFNQLETATTGIMRGDPSKGTHGYLGTNGRDAMDGEIPTWDAIEKAEKRIADQLKSPTAKSAFQLRAARYKNDLRAQISSHASSQSDVWSKGVADQSAQLAIDRIAASPNDPIALAGAAADLRNARIKAVQLAGAKPGDPVYQSALALADREFVTAHIGAIGTTDPKRAMQMAEKNKAILGESYDEVYDRYRARAAEAVGFDFARTAKADADTRAAEANAGHIANPAQPIYQQTVGAIPGGYSAAGLARLVQIESAGDPNAVSPSKRHVGLAQFDEATAREVGLVDRNDPKQSIVAAQRLAAKRGAYLRRFLGRQPTDAELYLAHQQGAGGAQKLLMNPDASAASLIGTKAVVQNGGKADMTAAEFVAMWTHRFNKTTPANAPAAEAPQVAITSSPWAQRGMPAPGDSAQPAEANVPQGAQAAATTPIDPEMLPRLGDDYTPADSKADAYDQVMNDPNLTVDERQAAITALNQMYAVEKIRQDEAARAKKDASDKALSDYTTRILTGKTEGIIDQIAADPNLEPESKFALINGLEADADQSVAGAKAAYGDQYYTVMQQVLADPGDPSRISNSLDILRMANDPTSGITMRGATKLIQTMKEVESSPDAASVTTTKAAMLEYGKSIISFNSQATPDPEGEMLFNAKFVSQFEAEFSNWIAKHPDAPFEFLTKENIDRIAGGLRSPREFEIAKALSSGGAGQLDVTRAFPVPQGADKQGWNLLFGGMPATTAQGKAITQEVWSQVLGRLYADPTPSAMKAFDYYFSNAGFTADDAMMLLTPAGVEVRKVPDKPAPPPVADPDRPGPHAVINGVPDLGLPLPNGEPAPPPEPDRDALSRAAGIGGIRFP